MTKYIALTKSLLTQQFRGKPVATSKGKNGKKSKGTAGKIGIAVLLIFAFSPIVLMIVAACFAIGALHATIDSSSTVAFMMLAIQSFVLIFGLPSLINGIFAPKDGDKLLYLPVSTATIFASKLTVAYVNELITAVVGVLIVLLPFGIGAGMGVGYYILLVPTVLLLPILPLTIGCILSLPLSALVRRFFNNTTIKTVVSILLFAGIMGVYMYGIFSLTSFLENIDIATGGMTDAEAQQYVMSIVNGFVDSIDGVMPYFLPNYLMATAMVATAVGSLLLNTLGAVGVNALLLAIAVLLAITTYAKNMSKSQEGSGTKRNKGNQKQYVYTSRAILPTMIITNLKRFFRDSDISMQMILGLLMPAFIVVIFGISFSMGAEDAGDLAMLSDPLVQMIIGLGLLAYLVLLCSASNVLAVYPFSLERNRLYMFKILPVTIETIMLSKVLMSTMLLTVCSVICAIVAIFTINLSWYAGIFMCIAMAIYQFATMCVTTYLDVRKPKLDWENYQSGLKNSKGSLISLLCGLIVMSVISGVGVVFVIWYMSMPSVIIEIFMWLAIIVVGLLYAYIAYRHLVFHGKRAFDNLEL